MPQIPQISANSPAATARYPTPTVEAYGGQSGAALAQAAEQFDIQYTRLQQAQYKALAHSQSILALDDYVKDTTMGTDTLFTSPDGIAMPTTARDEALKLWKSSRERVVKQYGGKDKGIQAAIDAKISEHDSVHFHKLIERTAKATQNQVHTTLDMATETRVHDAVFAESEAEADHAIKGLASDIGGYQGTAFNEIGVHDRLSGATQQISFRGGDRELRATPATIGGRLLGIKIGDPLLAGLDQKDVEARLTKLHEQNKEAFKARQQLKGDVLDADYVVALQRGAIGPKQFQELMDDKGKSKEMTMMFLIDNNQLKIGDLEGYARLHGINNPETIARARTNIHANLDRATKEDEKQRKTVEEANKTARDQKEFAIRVAAEDSKNPMSSQDVMNAVMPLVGKPGGFTGETAAKLVQDVRDIEAKRGPDNVRAYTEKRALIEADPNAITTVEILGDKSLNDIRTRELLALKRKLSTERAKADHFTKQPAFDYVESQLRADYQIGPLGIPTVQYAAAHKRLYDLADPSGEFKLQPWEAYKRVQKEAPPILKHEPLKQLDPRMNNVLEQYRVGTMTEEEVKKWAKQFNLPPGEVAKLKESVDRINKQKWAEEDAAEAGKK